MKNSKAAMEMSVGTIVTIVLLMTVLVMGLILVRTIFTRATESVDSITNQVMTETNNLFNTLDEEVIVNLGGTQTANIKRGTEGFGFVVGFYPGNPTELMANECDYSIKAYESIGAQYCTLLDTITTQDAEEWIITGKTKVKFSKRQKDRGYDLIRLSIPDNVPLCLQRFELTVNCRTGDSSTTYFDVNIIKKGMF